MYGQHLTPPSFDTRSIFCLNSIYTQRNHVRKTMETDHRSSLEQALAKTEADADAVCKAATAALRTLKKFRAAAQMGNLRDLQKAIDTAGQAIADLEQQFAKAKTGWRFDEDAYLSDGTFVTEL